MASAFRVLPKKRVSPDLIFFAFLIKASHFPFWISLVRSASNTAPLARFPTNLLGRTLVLFSTKTVSSGNKWIMSSNR